MCGRLGITATFFYRFDAKCREAVGFMPLSGRTSTPCQESNCRSSAIYPVACRHTDWAKTHSLWGSIQELSRQGPQSGPLRLVKDRLALQKIYILESVKLCFVDTVMSIVTIDGLFDFLLHRAPKRTLQIRLTLQCQQSRLHKPLLGSGFESSGGGRSPSSGFFNCPRASAMLLSNNSTNPLTARTLCFSCHLSTMNWTNSRLSHWPSWWSLG
jgi:hypothetical protein